MERLNAALCLQLHLSLLAGMVQAGQVCRPWQHHGQQQPAPCSAHPASAEGHDAPLQVGKNWPCLFASAAFTNMHGFA